MNLFSLKQLATPGVQSLSPYQPGKPLDELEREYGIKEAVKLASNENPLGPGALATKAIKNHINQLSRYPDGNGFALKEKLAKHHEIGIDQITLGNGSNDILELLTRAYVTPEHEIIFSQHAFAVYPIVTQAVGATAVVTPAINWGHDLDAMRNNISDRTKIIFIANPNNPTGTWLRDDELKKFLEEVPQHVLVVLDEAYFEYASDPEMNVDGYPDGSKWLVDFPNLIITRTFSKIYGLAGLRIGYSMSHPDVADILNRVRQPFNVNSLALCAAAAALDDNKHLNKSLECNVRGMQQLTQAFSEMDLEFIPSVGNFICVKVGDGLKIYESLLHHGVIVRPVANYELPEYLRITIGTPDENDRFIKALRKEIIQSDGRY